MDYKGPGLYGLNPPLWVSGATIAKGQWVTSPADNEIYQRIAATGGGTTDPADDITNYVARSYVRTAALPAAAVLAAYPGDMSATLGHVGATRVVVGAISVGVRTQALNITGRGAIDYLAAAKSASGTFRIEIIVDGRYVADETITMAPSQSALYIGSPSFGESTYKTQFAIRQPNGIVFKRSFTVHLTAVTTAAGTGCGVAYNVRSEA